MSDKSSSYNNETDIKRDGTVEIKGGQLIVKNPSKGGKAAVVSYGTGIKVKINGSEVKSPAAVFEDSQIKVEVEDKKPERKIEVYVEESNLSASVTVSYKNGEKYSIVDKQPKNETTIEAVTSGNIPYKCYTIDEAKAFLREKAIVFGIIEDALNDAINDGSGLPVVIAEGENPIDGTDDRIETRFDDNREYVEVNDRIDFYSIGKVPSVEPGQIVAEKIPGEDGKPGCDVLGNHIKQKSGRRISLKAGKGVRISEDGLKAYSEIEGRPELKDDTVSVYLVYEILSDVDVKTGNIEFVGDVIIRGSITEGMKVKAGNSVILYGSVNNGEITAGGDVTVYKNVISSKINAGCNDFLRYKIIDCFDNISKNLMSIFSGVSTLKETGKVPKIYKDGQIIKLLIDTRYNSLTQVINELRNILTDNREYIDGETVKVGATMVKFFTGKGPTLIENCFKLNDYADALKNQIDELKRQLRQPSNINASYVQNSSLNTSGSIMITGKGCYTSELDCKGDIIIDRPGSVTRGGTITAAGDVKIHELGSLGGALTSVSAGKAHTVCCEIAHVNSIIRVGDMSNKLDASMKKLKAYLYKGELLVEKSKM